MQVYHPYLLKHLRKRLNQIYNDGTDRFLWKFRWDNVPPFALIDELGRPIPTSLETGNFLMIDTNNLPPEIWVLVIRGIRKVDASTIPTARCSFYYFTNKTINQTMSYDDVSDAVIAFNTLSKSDGNDIDQSWEVVFDQAPPLFSSNYAAGLRFDFNIDLPLYCCQ